MKRLIVLATLLLATSPAFARPWVLPTGRPRWWGSPGYGGYHVRPAPNARGTPGRPIFAPRPHATPIAPVPPPPARRSFMPPAPTPHHAWLPGYWGYRAGHHVWIEGGWALPPFEGWSWFAPIWIESPGGWMLIEGRWAPTDEELVVEQAPPAPIVESPPPAPAPDVFWVDGYWTLVQRRWDWIGGHWEGIRPGYFWEQPRWILDGSRWRFVPGGWRLP